MKRISTLIIAAAVLLSGCRAADETPMFWTWLEDLPGVDMEAAFTHMEEAGIDAVMLHAASEEDYVKDIEIASRHGVDVYAWVWTLNPPRQERPRMLEEHPDWFSVNRNGQSLSDFKAYVNSYKFLCPALPEVRSYLAEKIEGICSIEGIKGICLDYCRLVDCVLPISLAYNYNLKQDTKVFPEYDFGYHPAMLEKFKSACGYDPRDQEDPSLDSLWCSFRCDQVTEFANMMAEIAHAKGKTVSASPFAAAGLARFMVFQDWGKWDLDYVFPMAYTDFYTMDASFARDATIDNNRSKGEGTVLGCGLDTELGGLPEDIFRKMDYAFGAGAQMISLYTIEGLDKPELRKEFKAYADSMRTLRRKEGGKVPFVEAEAPDPDPLSNTSLMQVVEKNMKRVVAGEPIHVKSVNGMVPYDLEKEYPELSLGSLLLIKSSPRLKIYRTGTLSDGNNYDIYFVTYGDIVSGWDIRAAE